MTMNADSQADRPGPGESRSVLIAGAAGDIETLVAIPKEAPRGIAVVCHPHPLHGGAMTNKVTYSLASCALKQDLAVARFNFRGVGRSQGAHDNTVGETDDCLTVVDWMRAHFPDGPLLLAGFSFGSFVALKAATRRPTSALISVAPPFGRYLGQANPPRPDCPWLILHSRDDDIVSYEETAVAAASYQPPPEWVGVDGAGHLFHGRLQDVQDAALPFIERVLPR